MIRTLCFVCFVLSPFPCSSPFFVIVLFVSHSYQHSKIVRIFAYISRILSFFMTCLLRVCLCPPARSGHWPVAVLCTLVLDTPCPSDLSFDVSVAFSPGIGLPASSR